MRAILTALAVTTLSLGCAVDADRSSDEGDVSEAEGALSAYGHKLVGAFETLDGASDFDKIVLKSDGTYFAVETIYCITAPCPARRDEGKFIGYKPAKSGYLGGLRLVSKTTGKSTYYRVSLGEANTSFKLSRDGKTFFKYESVTSFCQTTKDCSGQSYPHIMCVGSPVCGDPPPPPPPCGSAEPPKAECKPGGCSGQVCTDRDDLVTTCEWREHYACYNTLGICERGVDGHCGWRETPELTACIEGSY
jgi:eight-cysteine-cluster-containing protein